MKTIKSNKNNFKKLNNKNNKTTEYKRDNLHRHFIQGYIRMTIKAQV